MGVARECASRFSQTTAGGRSRRLTRLSTGVLGLGTACRVHLCRPYGRVQIPCCIDSAIVRSTAALARPAADFEPGEASRDPIRAPSTHRARPRAGIERRRHDDLPAGLAHLDTDAAEQSGQGRIGHPARDRAAPEHVAHRQVLDTDPADRAGNRRRHLLGRITPTRGDPRVQPGQSQHRLAPVRRTRLFARDGTPRTPETAEQRIVRPRIGVPAQKAAVRRGENGQRPYADIEAGADVRSRTALTIPVDAEGHVPPAGLATDTHRLDGSPPPQALGKPQPADLRQPHAAALEPDVLVGEAERCPPPLRQRPARQASSTPAPGLVQRAERGAIDAGRRFDHPPRTSLLPDPGGQPVEVLAGRLRIRLPLRTDRNPLAPKAAEGHPADAVAILPIALRQTPVPGEPRRLAPAGEGPGLLIRDVEPDPVRGHSLSQQRTKTEGVALLRRWLFRLFIGFFARGRTLFGSFCAGTAPRTAPTRLFRAASPGLITAPGRFGLSPPGAPPGPPGHSRGVLLRCRGKGDTSLMAVSATRFSGRSFSVQEVTLIREVVRDCSGLSRMELARTVCELLRWRRPNGRLKARDAKRRLRER